MKRLIIKVLAAQLLYVLLHMSHKWFPSGISFLLGCPEETIFQHMKMGFFSYLLINLAEIPTCSLPLVNRISRTSSRIVTTILLSFLVGALWYTVPVLFGEIHNVWVEILYSNIVLLTSLVLVVSLEQDLEQAKYSNSVFIMLCLLFLLVGTLYTLMAFHPPDIEVFSYHGH